MERLDEDARFEVFDLIAEFVDDGVFVLMSVCTNWQAQVLRSHRLWRYITISDSTEDCEAKLHIQLAMPKGLSLVVQVHFPLISLRALESVLQRKIANLIVVTNSSKQNRSEVFSILREMIVQHPKPQIASILWRDADGEHPYVPNPVQKQLIENAGLEDMDTLGHFLQEHPPFLLPRFDLKVSTIDHRPSMGIFRRKRTRRLEIPIRTYYSCVHTLRHLVSLSLHCQPIVERLGDAHEVVSLPKLQILDINLDLWPSGGPLLEVPKLRQLTLHGAWALIINYLTKSEHPLQLETLTLHTDQERIPNDIGEYSLKPYFHFTYDLILKLHRASDGMSSISAAFASLVQLFIESLFRVTRLHISLSFGHLNLLQGMHSAINIHTIQISDDSRFWSAVKELPVCQITCDTLVLKDARGPLPSHGPLPFDRFPRPRKLIISETPFTISELPHSWVSSLAEIEVDDGPETFVGAANDLFLMTFPTRLQSHMVFESLRYFKCEVRLVTETLLSPQQFPALEELYINKASDCSETEAKRILSLLPSTVCGPEETHASRILPQLHTLALDWFPEWKHIRTFLERWVGAHGTTFILTLKLPQRPARQVLSALVQLLNGVTPKVPFPGTSRYYPIGKLECRACVLAGWTFENNCKDRHGRVPMSELFSITKNTEY